MMKRDKGVRMFEIVNIKVNSDRADCVDISIRNKFTGEVVSASMIKLLSDEELGNIFTDLADDC